MEITIKGKNALKTYHDFLIEDAQERLRAIKKSNKGLKVEIIMQNGKKRKL